MSSKLKGALVGTLSYRLRHYSSSASDRSVVDQMIDYSRKNYKGNLDQAMDILKSGLSLHQSGPHAGRLYLAQADIEAERSKWSEVARLCRLSAASASEAQPSSPEEALLIAEVELAAVLQGTQAFLAVNEDAEAFNLAQQCMEVARKSFTAAGPAAQGKKRQGLVLASATAAAVQHVAADFDAASDSFDAVVSMTGGGNNSTSNSTSNPNNQQQDGSFAHHPQQLQQLPIGSVVGQQGEPSVSDKEAAVALKQAALFTLAKGEFEKAAPLAARAVQGAEQALSEASQDTSAAPLLSPLIAGEVLADSHFTRAQVSIAQKQWEDAENTLSKALSAVEALDGSSHPRTALVLTLLAGVYARTGRVTLAEGLYRESSKMLGLSPDSSLSDSSSATSSTSNSSSSSSSSSLSQGQPLAVHSSVGALLAWRHCQLLTALPNRGTEAAKWQKLARDLYDDAPIGRVLSPEASLGTLDSLKGKGSVGYGVVVDLMMRRALPKFPKPEEVLASSTS